jgi:hypothetical protein
MEVVNLNTITDEYGDLNVSGEIQNTATRNLSILKNLLELDINVHSIYRCFG